MPSGRSARSSDILGRVHLLGSSRAERLEPSDIFARERSSGNSARTPQGLARHITAWKAGFSNVIIGLLLDPSGDLTPKPSFLNTCLQMEETFVLVTC